MITAWGVASSVHIPEVQMLFKKDSYHPFISPINTNNCLTNVGGVASDVYQGIITLKLDGGVALILTFTSLRCPRVKLWN